MQVKALPEVAARQLVLLSNALPATFTVVDAEALFTVLRSLATTLMALLPLVEQVTEILLVVDVPVHPAARVQVYV